VIIRIATEGQYELADGDVPGLNELDNQAVTSCESGDEANFHDVFGQLLSYVREKGAPVPDGDLRGSDLILPPPDVSLAEARQEFSGEGLIPG